jgi:hypothetical protein
MWFGLLYFGLMQSHHDVQVEYQDVTPLALIELVDLIFRFLSQKELVQVSGVCKTWSLVSFSSPHWKKIFLYTAKDSLDFFEVDYIQPQFILNNLFPENVLELSYEFMEGDHDFDKFYFLMKSFPNIHSLRFFGISSFCLDWNELLFPKLKHLDIRGFDKEIAGGLKDIKDFCKWVSGIMPQLESFKLGWILESDKSPFNHLSHYWQALIFGSIIDYGCTKNLRTISAEGLSRFEGYFLPFASACLNLSALNLTCSINVTKILKVLPLMNLKDINVRASNIDDEQLYSIAKNCPLLSKINVGCTNVSIDGVMSIIENCPITVLDLCYCDNIGNQGIDFIVYLHCLLFHCFYSI